MILLIKLCEIELIICIKIDLALNDPQRLICHKTQSIIVYKKVYHSNRFISIKLITLRIGSRYDLVQLYISEHTRVDIVYHDHSRED